MARQNSPFGPSSGGAGGEVSAAESQLLRRIQSGNAYPWLYPTSDFQNFDKFGSVALPEATASATVGDGNLDNGNSLPFTVPKGYNGYIKAIAFNVEPNGSSNLWVPGVVPPQLIFVLYINGVPAADYGQVAYSPGRIFSPTPIAGVPIKEGNEVSVTVQNVSIAADTQFVMARLQGFYYGVRYQPKEVAY